MTNLHQKNRSILEKITNFTIPDEIPDYIKIQTAKSGDLTATLNGKYIHSKYNPSAEADKNPAIAKESSIAVILGFGLGYTVETWIRKNPGKSLLVIEHHPFFLTSAMKRDLSFLEESNVHIIKSAEVEDFFTFFKKQKINDLSEIVLIETHGAVNASQNFYLNIKASFNKALRAYFTDIFTELEFERLWFKNIILNTGNLDRAQAFKSLLNKFTGKNAILAGAGPSLVKNLDLIKSMYPHSIIFAVDTAVKTLLSAGITPDIIIAQDGQFHNLKDFFGVEIKDSILLCDITVHPHIPKMNFKNVFFFETADFKYENEKYYVLSHPLILWIKQCIGELGVTRSGGNVTTTSLELINLMGIKNLIFAGCDYGYPDKLFYAANTPLYETFALRMNRLNTLEKSFFEILKKRKLIKAKNYNDEPILTDIILDKYAAWTEKLGAQLEDEVNWYNMSAESLKIAGIPLIDKQTIDKKFRKQIIARPLIPALSDETLNTDTLQTRIAALYTGIKKIIEKLDNMPLQYLTEMTLPEFFELYPFLKRTFTAQILYLQKKDMSDDKKQDYLLGEIRFQLTRILVYLGRIKKSFKP